MFSQQWYPYTPENPAYPNRLGVNDINAWSTYLAPSASQPLVRINTYVRSQAIAPQSGATPPWGFVGDYTGEWFVWIDMNPNSTFVSTGTQMYGLHYVDSDLYYGTTFRSIPARISTGLHYTSFFGLFFLYSGLIYELPAQAGGTAYSYWPENGAADIHIATWYGPPFHVGVTVPVQIHTIGNIWSEVDGSGWCYMSQTLVINL